MPAHRLESCRKDEDDRGAIEAYAFESVAPDAGTPIAEAREQPAHRVSARVDVVREGGVVREIVVVCPCGECTRVRVEYEREA